jgi:hypothetical protein
MDMKSLPEPRPELGLPGAPKALAPAKRPEPLDIAERTFYGAMRDDGLVTATFFDGNEITGRPLALGKYSLLIEADGEEIAVFKHGLRSLTAHKKAAG